MTFIAFVYVVTCGGDVEMVIVNVKLLPIEIEKEERREKKEMLKVAFAIQMRKKSREHEQ